MGTTATTTPTGASSHITAPMIPTATLPTECRTSRPSEYRTTALTGSPSTRLMTTATRPSFTTKRSAIAPAAAAHVAARSAPE